MSASRSEIEEILGELDDLEVAEIERLGASVEEVREAREWVYSASIERRRGLPASPRVVAIADILRRRVELEEEEEPEFSE